MTQEQLDLLDQLILKGYVERTITLFDKAVSVTFRTLSAEQQLQVEMDMKGTEGTALYNLHQYSMKILAHALRSFCYKKQITTFATAAEAEQFLGTKPGSLVDELIREQGKLEKSVNTLIMGEQTVENFLQTPSVSSALK